MKKAFTLLTSSSVYLMLASSALAQSNRVETCPVGNFAPLCGLQLNNAIPAIVAFLFIISTLVALFYLIWGGFKWLTSGGDKTAVGAARDHIIAAIIGLVIIFLSYFILNLLLGFFIPGQSVRFFDLPSINFTAPTPTPTP